MITCGIYLAVFALVGTGVMMLLYTTCGLRRGFLATFWLPLFLLTGAVLYQQRVTNALGYGTIILLLLIFGLSLAYTTTGCVLTVKTRHDREQRRWLIPATVLSATPAMIMIGMWILKG
jgi:hypothetical protein